MAGLPMVPFAILPKISWKHHQEVKPRIDREEALLLAGVKPIEDNIDEEKDKDETLGDDDEDEESIISSVKSDKSEEEIPLYEYVATILPGTPKAKEGEAAPTIKIDERTGQIKTIEPIHVPAERPVWLEPPEPEPEVETCSKYLGRIIEEFRARQRIKRQHYILKEFEERIKKMDQKVREEIFEEIKLEEKNVMKEAIKAAKRRQANSKPQKPRKSKNVESISLPPGLNEEIEQRDREMERLDFFCNNLHYWRVDALQQEIECEEQLAKEEGAKAEREARRIRKEILDREIEETIKKDELVFKEDFEITQQVNKLMRQTGVVAGTNADTKKLPKKVVVKDLFIDELKIKLRDNVDFSGPKRRTANFEHPFDKDIMDEVYKNVGTLRCRSIGERGALSLAAAFIRGCTPIITILDLTRCEVQTRGFGRILHGLRLGNISSLRVLNARGNFITSRSLEYLKMAFESETLSGLAVLDLRDNEVGDDGADTIMKMIISNYFHNLIELHLQRNGIKDLGFKKIIKVCQSMQPARMANIQCLGLANNDVSSSIKRECYPIPSYVLL